MLNDVPKVTQPVSGTLGPGTELWFLDRPCLVSLLHHWEGRELPGAGGCRGVLSLWDGRKRADTSFCFFLP